MNQFHQKRVELANTMAAAGKALLEHTSTSAALAAIPNTAPQQYVVAGTRPMIAKVLPAESATDWRPYHSALSRCAELLDNMKEGDPITEVPEFLAAKLKVLNADLASQSQAAQPSDDDRYAVIVDRRDLFDFLRAAWRAGQDFFGPMTEQERWERATNYATAEIKGWSTMRPVHLAGQSQATRAVPGLHNAIKAAFIAGFKESGEGWNYEMLGDPESDPHFVARMNDYLAAKGNTSSASAAQEVTQQAAKAETAEQVKPELTVWYGPMPESNGKSNFTAVLMRKGEMWDGPHVTIERSEYPDRIRYEADRVRYLIGELAEEPFILDYDADKHSGYKHSNYVAPTTSTVSAPGEVREQWPVEPTPEMQQAGASAIRFDTTVLNKIWTANAVYRAIREVALRTTSGKGEAA